MKLFITAATIVLFSISTVAFAQSCATATPQGTIDGAGVPSFSGNNCNNNLTQGKICSNGDTLGGGGMDIIKWTVGNSPSNPVTLDLKSSAFTPELATVATTCSSNTTCLDDQSANVSATEATNTFSVTAGGTYYIFVANVADANCGAYTLSIPQTPVKLQNFSVK